MNTATNTNKTGLIHYALIWSPTGERIIKVWAQNAVEAKKRTPLPYARYKGEVYAIAACVECGEFGTCECATLERARQVEIERSEQAAMQGEM